MTAPQRVGTRSAEDDILEATKIKQHNQIGRHQFGECQLGKEDTINTFMTSSAFGNFSPRSPPRTDVGKFAVGKILGSGSFGSCYHAAYYPHGLHGLDGYLHDDVMNVALKFIVHKKLQGEITGAMPPSIANEVDIQKNFRAVEGAVHLYHAAEVEIVNNLESHLEVQRMLFGPQSTVKLTPEYRLFMIVFPPYDSDMHSRLWEETLFLHHGPQRGVYAAPPPTGEGYLQLTLRRFFRIKAIVDKMHHLKIGHGDCLPKNILARWSSGSADHIDLSDFGLAHHFADQTKLHFPNLGTCYPPEGLTGIPTDLKNSMLSQEQYMAFDYYCLGITLFEMLQSLYTHPQWQLHVSTWAECPNWLQCCRLAIEHFNTSPVIKEFVLGFLLGNGKGERYKKVQELSKMYPSVAALETAHLRYLPPIRTITSSSNGSSNGSGASSPSNNTRSSSRGTPNTSPATSPRSPLAAFSPFAAKFPSSGGHVGVFHQFTAIPYTQSPLHNHV